MEVKNNETSFMVDYKIENFIGVFKNAYPKEFCEEIINQYNSMVECGYGKTRIQSENSPKIHKDDVQIFSDEIESIPLRKNIHKFNELFWNYYYRTYENEYAPLKESGSHSNYSFKIQKTKIGGGYHIRHIVTGKQIGRAHV